jgi:phosphocarrier protein HPr
VAVAAAIVCASVDLWTEKTYNMIQQDLEIINKLGLHARASAKFTQLAAKFQSDVWLTRNARRINAKSIMGVMMLAAGKGAKVTLEADGPDEKECVEALTALINDKFGEGE